MATFVFDLDMTLVDSSALDGWREARMWRHVRKNLEQVQPFSVGSPAPHEIPERLRSLGHDVAVVTSSPRWYAAALVERFQIETDVLVAWGDTGQHKPDPEPIAKALEELGVDADPDEVFHVGDAAIDVEASYHAGVTSICAGWGVSNFEALSSAAPDILLRTPKFLLCPDELGQRGYLAEMLCAGMRPKTHPGTVLPCGNSPIRRYALGRYFKTEDPRHADSALAARILELKNEDGPSQMFGRALATFVKKIGWTPDYLVPVPPKPSQPRNRFEAVLDAADSRLPAGVEVVLDGLECVREVEGYKAMGPLERAQAIRKAFESSYIWKGRKILLVDDVLTSGETVAECARVLLVDKALEVRIVTLGRDQQTFVKKECPECDRPMRVRTNRRTREKFWGCSGYPECRHTESM